MNSEKYLLSLYFLPLLVTALPLLKGRKWGVKLHWVWTLFRFYVGLSSHHYFVLTRRKHSRNLLRSSLVLENRCKCRYGIFFCLLFGNSCDFYSVYDYTDSLTGFMPVLVVIGTFSCSLYGFWCGKLWAA